MDNRESITEPESDEPKGNIEDSSENEPLLSPSEKVRSVYLAKAARNTKPKPVRPARYTPQNYAPRFSGSGSRLGGEVQKNKKPEITEDRTDGKLFSGKGILLTPNEQIKAVYVTNTQNRKKKPKSDRPNGAHDNSPFSGMTKSAWN